MAITITSNIQIIKSTQENFKVEFSQVEIDNYLLSLRFDSENGYLIDSGLISAGSTSYTFKKLENLTRGRSIFAEITDLRTGKIITFAKVAVVNRTPDFIVFGQDIVSITTDGSVTFSITGSDPDGSVKKVHWSAGTQSGSVTGSSLTKKFLANDFSTGVYAVNFTLEDDLGETSTRTGYFEVVHKPVISKLQVTYEKKPNYNGTKNLPVAATISYTLSRPTKINDYDIAAFCDSIGGAVLLKNGNKNGAIISQDSIKINILESNIPEGQSFKIQLSVKNDAGSSFKEDGTVEYMYKKIGALTKLSYKNDDSKDSNIYYKENITVTFNNPILTDFNFGINRIYIKTTKKEYDGNNLNSGEKNSITIKEPNGSTIIIIDSAGNYYSNLFGINLKKLGNIVFPADNPLNFEITPNPDFKYYISKSTLTIGHRKLLEQEVDGRTIIGYNYSLSLNGATLALPVDDKILEDISSTNNDIKLKSVNNLRALIDSMNFSKDFDLTENYTATVTLGVIDSFGYVSKFSENFEVIFNTPLELYDKDWAFFHAFNQDFILPDDPSPEKLTEYPNCYKIIQGDETNLFHRGEKIIIQFPKIRKDNNTNILHSIILSNGINTIEIVLERNKEGEIIQKNNFKCKEKTDDKGVSFYECYYVRTIPTYSSVTTEKYSFQTKTTGNQISGTFSSSNIDPPSYCECWPVNVPQIGVVQSVKEVEKDKYNIVIDCTFDDKYIGDLTSFKNSHFIRQIGTGNNLKYIGGDITAKVFISESETFPSIPIASITGKLLEGEKRLDFTSKDEYENEVKGNRVFFKFKTDLKKFYMKFIITFSIGIEDTIDSIAVIQYYYGNTPTIAHRYHRVGINTNEFSANNDEILVIRDYDNYKTIRLIGKDGTIDRAITINVQTGEIDGLNIQCGFW